MIGAWRQEGCLLGLPKKKKTWNGQWWIEKIAETVLRKNSPSQDMFPLDHQNKLMLDKWEMIWQYPSTRIQTQRPKIDSKHTSHRSAIHQLKLCKCLSLNMCVGPWTCWFSASDLQIHIFYLNSHKKKIYLANNNIFQMIPAYICTFVITHNLSTLRKVP